MMSRKICVVLTDRANYGRLWPVMRAISEHPDLDLLTLVSGSMVLNRFGRVENIVARDGFNIDGRVFMELEGSLPLTMAKSTGLGIMEFATEFQRLDPDLVLVIGDRYEALAAVIAASFMNITIAHIQGGEVSGSIDESIRHSITKFSHYHFPSTQRSAEYIIRMGEAPQTVFMTGCPGGDYIIPLDPKLPDNVFAGGSGAYVSPCEPFILVIFHPVTTGFGSEKSQVANIIEALENIGEKVVWFWPNIDAGADAISKVLRVYKDNHVPDWLHLIKNFEPTLYQRVLKSTACAVGNSSSFVRDSSFSGVPVVLVGNRQAGREHGPNVLPVEPDTDSIEKAVRAQLQNGRYEPSTLYGDGKASGRIVEALANIDLYSQKLLAYVHKSDNERGIV